MKCLNLAKRWTAADFRGLVRSQQLVIGARRDIEDDRNGGDIRALSTNVRRP